MAADPTRVPLFRCSHGWLESPECAYGEAVESWVARPLSEDAALLAHAAALEAVVFRMVAEEGGICTCALGPTRNLRLPCAMCEARAALVKCGCGGSGIIEVGYEASGRYHDGDLLPIERTCPTCNGDGYFRRFGLARLDRALPQGGSDGR